MPITNNVDGVNDHKASAHRKEDHRRLSCALDYLRKYTSALLHGQACTSAQSMNFYWESWWDRGK